MSDSPTADQLLADAAWLKRLAVTLAGNEDDADDLVQQSWIAAWQRTPDASRPLRPWLAKVMRDVAGMHRRSERRRELREQASHHAQAPAPPDELLAQVRLHRVLVDLVLELDEPYRSTVIARFVDGRSAVAIARSLGIPDSTVRARLREALSRLRAQLDAKTGERKTWAPAVLAFAQRGIDVAKPIKPIALVVALLALLLATAITIVIVMRSSPDPTVAGEAHEARDGHTALAVTATDELARVAAGRPAGWIVQEGALSRRIAGRVIADGEPVAGAQVRLSSEPSLAGLVPTLEQRTDGDGRFDFGSQLPRPYIVGASAPGKLAAIQHVDVRAATATDALVLVLGPCTVALYGKVADSSGAAIPHARILREDVIGAEADGTGAYELCALPSGLSRVELRIVVRATGFGAVTLSLAPVDRVRHDFVLSPEAVITGRAITSSGTPIANAEIVVEPDEAVTRPGSEQNAPTSAATDADGRFRVAGLGAGRHFVSGRGHGVASAPTVMLVVAGETRDIVLTMEATAIVRGRVVTAGEPVAGVKVAAGGDDAVSQVDGSFVLDRVPIGDITFAASPRRVRSPSARHIVAGDNAITLEVEALGSVSGVVRRRGEVVGHARVVIYAPGGSHNHATYADDSGAYAIDGIEPDDYTIHADSHVLGAFADKQTFSLALGEHHTLDLELARAARVSGSVVDAANTPVPHAFVVFERTDVHSYIGNDQGQCATDERGRFDCTTLAGSGSYRSAVYAGQDASVPYRFVAEPAPVLVPDGEARVDGVHLVVDARQLSMRGTVVDSTGAAVADARVSITANVGNLVATPTTITDPKGAFEIASLAPGTYNLLAERSEGTKTTARGIDAGATGISIVVDPPSCSPSTAQPTHRPAGRIAWDDKVELVGWDMPDKVHLGDSVDVAVYYRVLQPLGRSWKAFVHIDIPKKTRVSADHDPLAGRCPTSSWQPGDLLVDRFTTRITDTAGTYQVWIGFFRGWAGNWINLPISDGAASVRDDQYNRIKLAELIAE